MLDKVRNIGIMAHVDAGKTTTTERILYYSGTKHKVGDVDDGDTTTDFDPLERQKGITINSAAVSIDWGENDDQHHRHARPRRLHGRGRAVACASSTARVGVFCAVGGVEVQSETVWWQANKYKVPRLAYVNKLDRMGADFWGCVEQMKKKLLANPGDRHHPGRAGRRRSKGIIDLIQMKFVTRDATDKTNRKFFIDRHPGEVQGRGRRSAASRLLDGVSVAVRRDHRADPRRQGRCPRS